MNLYDLNDYIANAIQKILEINMKDNDKLIEKISEANNMEDIARCMIQWIHENILFQKRQMLINTYQLLEEFEYEKKLWTLGDVKRGRIREEYLFHLCQNCEKLIPAVMEELEQLPESFVTVDSFFASSARHNGKDGIIVSLLLA